VATDTHAVTDEILFVQSFQPLSVQLLLSIQSHVTTDDQSVSRVRVTLRPTASRSVSLGVEPRLGLMTRCYVLIKSASKQAVAYCWHSPA
jgi:hypothetical protein